MIPDKVKELCATKASVTSLLNEDPNLTPEKALDRLVPEKGITAVTALMQKKAAGWTDDVYSHLVTADLETARSCGNFEGTTPSRLFLQIWYHVLRTLEKDHRAGVVSPSLMGSTGVVPLTIMSIIPDIMRHYANLIIHAEKFVFLATNFWAASNASHIVTDALRELSRRRLEKGLPPVDVKILYDRGSMKQVLNNHLDVEEKDWNGDKVKIPKQEEVKGITLQVVNYHIPPVGTFHAKWMVIDGRVAVLNSNNIQDVPNLEMMVHYEGAIVDSFYDSALISWNNALKPPLKQTFYADDEKRKNFDFADAHTIAELRATEQGATVTNEEYQLKRKQYLDKHNEYPAEQIGRNGKDLVPFAVQLGVSDATINRSLARSRGASAADGTEHVYNSASQPMSGSGPVNGNNDVPAEAGTSTTESMTKIRSGEDLEAGDRNNGMFEKLNLGSTNTNNGSQNAGGHPGPLCMGGSPVHLSEGQEDHRDTAQAPPLDKQHYKDWTTAELGRVAVNEESQEDAARVHNEKVMYTGKSAAAGTMTTQEGDGIKIEYDDTISGEAKRVKAFVGTVENVTKHLNTTIQPNTKSDLLETDTEVDIPGYNPYILHQRHEPFPMAMVNRRPFGQPGHQSLRVPQNEAWIAALRLAKTQIFIQTPDLNSSYLIPEIPKTIKRGVGVVLYLTLGYNDSGELLPFQNGTNEQVVRQLYEALSSEEEKERLKVYWYTAKDMRKPKHAKSKQRTSHIKLMIADGHIGIQGSGNQDTQSWYHSQETNVIIDSAEVCTEWLWGIRSVQNTHIFGRVGEDGVWRAIEGRDSIDGSDMSVGQELEGTNAGAKIHFGWARGVKGAIERVQGVGGF